MKTILAKWVFIVLFVAMLPLLVWRVYAEHEPSIDSADNGHDYDVVEQNVTCTYSPTARLKTWDVKANEGKGDWKYDNNLAASSSEAGQGGHVSGGNSCYWENSNFNNQAGKYSSTFRAKFTATGCTENFAPNDSVKVKTTYQGTPHCCGHANCPYPADNDKWCTCEWNTLKCTSCGVSITYCAVHYHTTVLPHETTCPYYRP